MKLNKTQVSVIIGSVILIVLLLFANTKLPKKEDGGGMSEHAGSGKFGIDKLLEETKNSLSAAQKQKYSELEAVLNVSANKKDAFENTVHQWDSLRQPVISAHFKEQEAIAFPSEKNWLDAANRYYALANLLKGEQRIGLFEKAIECFEKTLEQNPDNTEAKIDLAACYVEKGDNPMKGIGMLREIEKTDSNNVKLQLNFAYFSMRSGQWDRAIARFEKVLKLKPDYVEIYLHLADVYDQKGDKAKSKECLEKFVALTDDITLKKEVQGYIDKLKNN